MKARTTLSSPASRSPTARWGMVWLLVAAILAHAALPTGSALQRRAGSAFSVTTSEVTTIPRRDIGQQRVASEQAGDPATPAAVSIAPVIASLELSAGAPTWHPVPNATAPPDGRTHQLFQARAPPSLPATA